jgi:hypothetical protein
MPRRPRVFVSGAMYHVYCRTSRGEPILADRVATEGFVEIVRQVKRRDGLTVFAWCVMSNHSGAGSSLGPGGWNAQALGRYSRQDSEVVGPGTYLV